MSVGKSDQNTAVDTALLDSHAAESEVADMPSVLLREIACDEVFAQAKVLAEATGISLIAARILLCRGVNTPELVDCFLRPNMQNQIPNPIGIKNISDAADLLLEFAANKEQITVYTDFDVDGLSAGAQLFLYLKALGAKVNTYTPSRFAEGYGLVCSAVETLAKAGTKLLVTVDCGISSHKEFALAKRLGMKSIVLDHHIPSGLPPADVVVDPAQEGCAFQEYKLAAAGLVWMLLVVLRQRARERMKDNVLAESLPNPKDFLDLAALGTICDMVPLNAINRVIAHRGVEALRVSRRPGIVALKKVAGLESNARFGAGHVGFALGPRINAAGRLADAADVMRMLTTEDSIDAEKIASTIDRLNEERRRVEEEVKLSCLDHLQRNPLLTAQPAFAIFGEEYHIGVIGIVAQRLVEHFNRPAAVMAPGEMIIGGGERRAVIKGSVRSVPGFHVADVLQSLSPLLLSQGGHREAGGFSLAIENLEKFQSAFIAKAVEIFGDAPPKRRISADIIVKLNEIDFILVNELQLFAPFGVGNSSPVLVTNQVDVSSVNAMGEKHIRVRFTDGTNTVVGVGWGMQSNALLRKGKRVSIAYQPEINVYQGVSSVQLNLRDVW